MSVCVEVRGSGVCVGREIFVDAKSWATNLSSRGKFSVVVSRKLLGGFLSFLLLLLLLV